VPLHKRPSELFHFNKYHKIAMMPNMYVPRMWNPDFLLYLVTFRGKVTELTAKHDQ